MGCYKLLLNPYCDSKVVSLKYAVAINNLLFYSSYIPIMNKSSALPRSTKVLFLKLSLTSAPQCSYTIPAGCGGPSEHGERNKPPDIPPLLQVRHSGNSGPVDQLKPILNHRRMTVI